MVRTKGTILSLGAAGSIHKTLIASNWKGRQYLKTHAIPSNPQSGEQTSIRTMFAFLSTEWDSASVSNKATWEEGAKLLHITPFNHYIQANLNEWSSLLYPSRLFPIEQEGYPLAGSYNCSYEGNQIIKLWSFVSTLNQSWGSIIHESMSPGFNPDLTNVIIVHRVMTLGVNAVFWRKASFGTHYFRWRWFSTNGNGALKGLERSATVT